MKKFLLLLFIVAGGICTGNAQLLTSDSSFRSLNGGITFDLTGVDSSFHDAGNCREAYAYSKTVNPITQQLAKGIYRTHDYLPNGNLRQVVIQIWNQSANSYVNSSRTTYTYYQSTTNIVTGLTEVWANNSAWRNSSLETNTYDASGYLTVKVNQSWDIPSAMWVRQQQTDYYNKGNGLADSAINRNYEGNVVTEQTKDIYSYVGATSSVARIVNQTRLNNQWQDSARSTFTYSSGRVTQVNVEAYSMDTQTWDLVGRTVFSCNSAGEILQLTLYTYFGSFAIIIQTRYKHQPCTTVAIPPGQLCGPSGTTTLTAGLTGGSYQWQVNTGGSFTNITNNGNYTGATTATLTLSGIPSSWYGYQYRCVVSGQNSGVTILKFVNKWTGATNNAWETGSNWSCGAVPDANSDVVIPNGTVVLTSNTSVRSLTLSPGVSFTTNTGFKLTINH